MSTYAVSASRDPSDFLDRAGPWLLAREDLHNLLLGLARARAASEVWPEGECFAVVERAGAVVGCVARTPPFKVLVTDLPAAAGPAVAAFLADRYDEIPAVFGREEAARGVAEAWVRLRGGGLRRGMPQGLYRLDEVEPPEAVEGAMRPALEDDVELLVVWGEAFGRDTGIPFPGGREPIERWIAEGGLYVWERAGEAVSVAVAHGRTANGVRIGYVYTPPEHRRRGFAGALVAALSQRMLDGGLSFCVLYTDLTNQTSNALYRRLGYRLVEELVDVDITPPGTA